MKESSWIRYSENARVATDAEKVSEESQQKDKNTGNVVRVNIQIETGSQKEDVIERISKEVLNGSLLDIQNKDIADDMFTVNLSEDKAQAVKAVLGVKDVTVIEADKLTDSREMDSREMDSRETEQSTDMEKQNIQAVWKEKENTPQTSNGQVLGLIVLSLVLVLFVGRKLHKKFR